MDMGGLAVWRERVALFGLIEGGALIRHSLYFKH